LEPDERGAQRVGKDPRDLGLSHARLAFEEQRLLHPERQKDTGRQIEVGEIALLGEAAAGRLDGV
jgi:hypothetical protein